MLSQPPPAYPLGESSTGPLAVFVHGLEDDWRTWESLARRLAAQWRCVALDMPWRSGNDYRWRWSAPPGAWLSAALHALGEVPDVLIGHSLGANAVLGSLSAQDSTVAHRAVLIAPMYRAATAPVTWHTFARSRKAFEEQIGHAIRIRLRSRSLHAELVSAMLEKTFDRIGPVGFLAVFEEYVASGHLPLSRVRLPTLVLGGDRDPGVARTHLEALVARLPNASLSCVHDHDHFGHVLRPDEVAGHIGDFARVVATPSRTGGA
jgi:pimeloyl-ACP methyl ester carboxylesterase